MRLGLLPHLASAGREKQMGTVPRYRADITGQVANFIADFEATVRGEIEHSDNFIFAVEDCEHAVTEYKDYLTEREMATAFKRAQRAAA